MVPRRISRKQCVSVKRRTLRETWMETSRVVPPRENEPLYPSDCNLEDVLTSTSPPDCCYAFEVTVSKVTQLHCRVATPVPKYFLSTPLFVAVSIHP